MCSFFLFLKRFLFHFFFLFGGLLLKIIVTLYCLDCSANTELQLILPFFLISLREGPNWSYFLFFFSDVDERWVLPSKHFFLAFFPTVLTAPERHSISLIRSCCFFFFPLLFSRFVYFSFPLFSEIDARFCSFGTFNITFVAQHILYLFFPQPSAPTVALRLPTLFWSFSFCSVFLQPVFFSFSPSYLLPVLWQSSVAFPLFAWPLFFVIMRVGASCVPRPQCPQTLLLGTVCSCQFPLTLSQVSWLTCAYVNIWIGGYDGFCFQNSKRVLSWALRAATHTYTRTLFVRVTKGGKRDEVKA